MNTASPRPASCADDRDPNALSVSAALARIGSEIRPITGRQRLALRDSLDRVLAAEIVSPIDVPAHVNSAMDGYALLGADLPSEGDATLDLLGTAYAGQPFAGRVGPGECVRIMTGAVMPQATDTVVMQEEAEAQDDRVRIGHGHRPGQHVRQAGEDLARGSVVLAPGTRIRPVELGLLASLGFAEVGVVRRPRVAFFSTGDELRSLGETLAEGEIYDSNRYTLFGMLERFGAAVIDMGVVRDRREDLAAAFREADAMADVVITTGGVSVGEADFVKETLQALGAVSFWKIAMKPGRPLAFGHLGDNALFFGLPGNPVSVMVTFYQFVQPALRRLLGERDHPPTMFPVPCANRLRKRPGRTEFQRGILYHDDNGELRVGSTGGQGSGILSSVSQANCFIVLPEDCGNLDAGATVQVQPFEGMV
jgi:molybdopterin molybdotransferase